MIHHAGRVVPLVSSSHLESLKNACCVLIAIERNLSSQEIEIVLLKILLFIILLITLLLFF